MAMAPADDDSGRWERMYQEEDVRTMRWYYPGLDPDFEQFLAEDEIEPGSALDICAGPGTQALALAERGYQVTATDISATAVRKAAALAAERGVEVDFRQSDILHNRLKASFGLVIDRGCFHIFPPEQRDDYVRNVAALTEPGGYLLMKCFSYREKRKEGPYRLHPEEIRERFGGLFDVLSIEESIFPGDNHKVPPIALFCVMQRC
jgi:SAM-dependent methyltransferase